MKRIQIFLQGAFGVMALAVLVLLPVLIPTTINQRGEEMAMQPSVTPLTNLTAVPPTHTPPVHLRAENIVAGEIRPLDPTGNAIFLAWSPNGRRFLFRKNLASYNFGDQWAVLGDL